MNLIRKADVKAHLSTGSTSVYPFGLKKSDAKAADGSKDSGAEAEPTDISISPSHPISPEAVPNAQVGGSIGVPASAENSGKGPW
jgi:hypothetical protein